MAGLVIPQKRLDKIERRLGAILNGSVSGRLESERVLSKLGMRRYPEKDAQWLLNLLGEFADVDRGGYSLMAVVRDALDESRRLQRDNVVLRVGVILDGVLPAGKVNERVYLMPAAKFLEDLGGYDQETGVNGAYTILEIREAADQETAQWIMDAEEAQSSFHPVFSVEDEGIFPPGERSSLERELAGIADALQLYGPARPLVNRGFLEGWVSVRSKRWFFPPSDSTASDVLRPSEERSEPRTVIPRETAWRMTRDQVERFASEFLPLADSFGEGYMRDALSAYFRSLRESGGHAIAFAYSAVEACVAPDTGDSRYKTAVRCAALLANSAADRKFLFQINNHAALVRNSVFHPRENGREVRRFVDNFGGGAEEEARSRYLSIARDVILQTATRRNQKTKDWPQILDQLVLGLAEE